MIAKFTMYVNGPNGHKIYQHLPLQDLPKVTQIGILGLKINHLATLPATTEFTTSTPAL
jgi:hypothetical protein